jgi:hypothetical protein
VGLYLKTGSNQFLANNFPNSRSNVENIRFTDDWATVANGPMNIFGTVEHVAPWLDSFVHLTK